MSGTWGMIGGTLVGQGGGAAADPLTLVQHSSTVTVTAHATAHTKGAWTEVIASTSADAHLVVLDVSGVSASGTETATLIDLAVGGSGSEVAFLTNLPVGSATAPAGDVGSWQIALPVSIPSGSRIAARIQSVVTGGKTGAVTLGLFSGGEITPGPLTVLGANAGTSRGASLDATWTQIAASTAATYRHLIIAPSLSGTAFGAGADAVDLAVGGSGNEVQIGSIRVARTTLEQVGNQPGRASWAVYGIFPGAAAGSRLTLRRGAGLAALDGVIIGVE